MDKSAENKKPIKNRKRFHTFLNIFIIIFSLVLLVVEGFIYYQRSYLTPFWVNGQSMYPTLNGDATDAYGNKLTATSGNAHDGYIVDYGVMDCHKAAINRIKRFDIIVTEYSTTDTSNKIKRVIGLPGETLRFVHTSKGAEYNNDLYVNNVLCLQPIDIDVLRNSSKYPTYEFTLGDDEYYVLGDNRDHSKDSRDVGPIKKEYITGKAIAICGTCEVYNDGTNLDIRNIKHHAPRFL